MKYRDAVKLHNEDEVIIKSTGEVRKIIETVVVDKEETVNHVACVSILLDNGIWYGHKEIV